MWKCCTQMAVGSFQGSCSYKKQELCRGFLTPCQALEEQSSQHIPSGKRNSEIMEIATFLFPSQLSALVLQSNQCSPLGLCQGCSSVASVPETSVICVLSLNLMVFRKTLPLRWGNITQSWVSAALFSCGQADLLELWVPEDFTSKHLKKPNCFGSNVTEASRYMLECCLFITSTALLCAESIQARKAGVGAASSVGGNGLHLQWTCSFCFM